MQAARVLARQGSTCTPELGQAPGRNCLLAAWAGLEAKLLQQTIVSHKGRVSCLWLLVEVVAPPVVSHSVAQQAALGYTKDVACMFGPLRRCFSESRLVCNNMQPLPGKLVNVTAPAATALTFPLWPL